METRSIFEMIFGYPNVTPDALLGIEGETLLLKFVLSKLFIRTR